MELTLESEQCPKCGRENSVHIENCHKCGQTLPWAKQDAGAPAGRPPAGHNLSGKEAMLNAIALLDFGFGLFLWCGSYFGFAQVLPWTGYFMMALGGGFYIFKERALEAQAKSAAGRRRR